LKPCYQHEENIGGGVIKIHWCLLKSREYWKWYD